MAGNQLTGMLSNPKFMSKAAYFLFIGFGAYHFTKLFFALSTGLVMAKFGKPSLVRETSKIYTNNYLAIPYMYAKKMIHQRMRRTEADLL